MFTELFEIGHQGVQAEETSSNVSPLVAAERQSEEILTNHISAFC